MLTGAMRNGLCTCVTGSSTFFLSLGTSSAAMAGAVNASRIIGTGKTRIRRASPIMANERLLSEMAKALSRQVDFAAAFIEQHDTGTLLHTSDTGDRRQT